MLSWSMNEIVEYNIMQRAELQGVQRSRKNESTSQPRQGLLCDLTQVTSPARPPFASPGGGREGSSRMCVFVVI